MEHHFHISGSVELQAEEAREYSKTWNDSIADDVFGGVAQSTLVCQECRYVGQSLFEEVNPIWPCACTPSSRASYSFDEFHDLTLPIPSSKAPSVHVMKRDICFLCVWNNWIYILIVSTNRTILQSKSGLQFVYPWLLWHTPLSRTAYASSLHQRRCATSTSVWAATKPRVKSRRWRCTTFLLCWQSHWSDSRRIRWGVVISNLSIWMFDMQLLVSNLHACLPSQSF